MEFPIPFLPEPSQGKSSAKSETWPGKGNTCAGLCPFPRFRSLNVAKSSMINAIIGQERMVVSNISGTTRDAVDTLLTRDRYKYLLIDTAGIRRKGKTHDKLEKFSILKALKSLGRCDIALVIIDAGEGITEQ